MPVHRVGGGLGAAAADVRHDSVGTQHLAPMASEQSDSCSLTAFFLPLRGPGVTALLGAGRFIRGGGEPKKASGTHHKYENTQLAAAILDIKVLSLKSQRSRKGIATYAARALHRSIMSSSVVI